MADEAHQAAALVQVFEGAQGQIQGLWIEAAEALVDEHGVQADAARVALHHVGQSQGQGQAGLEALAARQRTHRPGPARVAVRDLQLQAAGPAQVQAGDGPAQGVALLAHAAQALRSGQQHLVQDGALYEPLVRDPVAVISARDPGQVGHGPVAPVLAAHVGREASEILLEAMEGGLFGGGPSQRFGGLGEAGLGFVPGGLESGQIRRTEAFRQQDRLRQPPQGGGQLGRMGVDGFAEGAYLLGAAQGQVEIRAAVEMRGGQGLLHGFHAGPGLRPGRCHLGAVGV